MKNRKVIVTAFLLIAVMIVGVGYAAVSDTLFFNGSAHITGDQAQAEFDIDVVISDVAVHAVNTGADATTPASWTPFQAGGNVEIDKASEDGVSAIVNIIDDAGTEYQDQASFQLSGLTDANDYQVIWFKITNGSAHDAALTVSTVQETGTGDYFEAERTVYKADGSATADVIPAGGEVIVKLVITLRSTPTENYNASFSFTVTAEVQ